MNNIFNRVREESFENLKMTTNGSGKLYIGNLGF